MVKTARPSQEMIEKYTAPVSAAHPTPPKPDIGTIYVEFLADSNVGIKQMRTFAQTPPAATSTPASSSHTSTSPLRP